MLANRQSAKFNSPSIFPAIVNFKVVCILQGRKRKSVFDGYRFVCSLSMELTEGGAGYAAKHVTGHVMFPPLCVSAADSQQQELERPCPTRHGSLPHYQPSLHRLLTLYTVRSGVTRAGPGERCHSLSAPNLMASMGNWGLQDK